ncbi:MAG: hypothetical protein KAW41_07070 [Candidatus Diapherotrites archaeon]|nr:hypothetical protein [Candidatus Diapherotrites archaeon]
MLSPKKKRGVQKDVVFELTGRDVKTHFKGVFQKSQSMLMLAEGRKVYHRGTVDIPILKLSKIHPKLLKTYLNRIVTLDFEGKFKDVLDHVVSHVVVSRVKEMKPDKSEKLFSEFTPLVRRRLANVTNVIFLKRNLPISEILMVVDYFRGSAPEEIKTKKAEKEIAEILMTHFLKKNPRSVTGLLVDGPRKTFALVAFHMDYGKESYGFKKTRSTYKEKIGLAHEEDDHKV